MTRQIVILFFLLIIFIQYEHTYGGSFKTLIVHINDQVIEFKKKIPEFDKSIPNTLKIFPKKVYTVNINNNLSFLILHIDPIKSDLGDIIFLSKYKETYQIIDYVYNVSGSNIQDILLWDIDGDNISESILLWGDEDSYQIVIYKLLIQENSIKTTSIYTSHWLGNPSFEGYGKKMKIYNGSLYFIYNYNFGGEPVHKYATLLINLLDSTKEPYLMPMGLITKEEWLKMH